jgi:hypothetical protein
MPDVIGRSRNDQPALWGCFGDRNAGKVNISRFAGVLWQAHGIDVLSGDPDVIGARPVMTAKGPAAIRHLGLGF